MQPHLPIMQILLPLVGAPLCLLFRRRRVVIVFATVVAWATFGISVTLLAEVLRLGPVTYQLGGWTAPWGIEYRVDALGAFVILFVSAIGAAVITYAPRSLDHEISRSRHYLLVTLYLLCLAGLLGIAITGDLFNLFVFLEISSLSSYALISLGSERRALTAAYRYLILGTIGATFILIGIGLMYMMTGTLNMADMAVRIEAMEGKRTVLAAFAFLTTGIGLKAAVFPLHLWLPDAYTYAPSVVSALLAATATKVSVYVLLRFVFTVFGTGFAFIDMPLGAILLPMALAGVFVASTVAIFQSNVKRMLAYSSVAQIGYMVLGISFASMTGLTSGIVHLFNHALIKGGLFLAMGCFMLRLGSTEIDDLRGVGHTMPWTSAAWVIGGLGLIGVPATAGFVSKWYLVSAALEQRSWLIAGLVLLGSLLALIYVWRFVEVAYFREPAVGREAVREAPLPMLAATWLLIGATVLFGAWAPLPVGLARRAAEALLGPSP